MDASVSQELDRVLARSLLGDTDAVTAVQALCSVLERRGVTCALVRHAHERAHTDLSIEAVAEVTGSAAAERDTALVSRLARHTGPYRALLTRVDARWAALVGDAHERVSWAACEAVVAEDGGCHASVVVLGASEPPCEVVLLSLPDIARACGAVLDVERQAALMRQRLHDMTNLLTSMSMNVEYASLLLDERSDEQPLPTPTGPRGVADARTALRNATRASVELARHMAALATLSASRRTQ
jgi:hypothetical protein